MHKVSPVALFGGTALSARPWGSRQQDSWLDPFYAYPEQLPHPLHSAAGLVLSLAEGPADPAQPDPLPSIKIPDSTYPSHPRPTSGR